MPFLGLFFGVILGYFAGVASEIGGFGAFSGAVIGLLCGMLVNQRQTLWEMGEQLKKMDAAIRQLQNQAQQPSRLIISQAATVPTPASVTTPPQASAPSLPQERSVPATVQQDTPARLDVPLAEPVDELIAPPVEAPVEPSFLLVPEVPTSVPTEIPPEQPELVTAPIEFAERTDIPVIDTALALEEEVAPVPEQQALPKISSTGRIGPTVPVTPPVAMPALAEEAALAEKSPTIPATPTPVPAPTQPTPAPAASTPELVRRPPPPRPPHPVPQEPQGPSFIEHGFLAAKEWLFGGNTLVRMGMLLVFLGLAFLLRYASDRVVIPLEVRYLGVACAAFAALVLGWRLRIKRPAYALLMQGGSVAVMYLTVFAALKLHNSPLIPLNLGLFLLVAVAALSAILAITQNAMSLAVAGSLGGFAAPVLVSTGGGSHVALFSYFALLNAAILAIAWFKAWRPLNLIGFFGTFSIGLSWGMRSYQPEHYASCQGFLILFFLMFVGIGLLFARRMLLEDPDAPRGEIDMWADWLTRQGHRAQRYVDGTILFGTPLVGFGIQHTLVKQFEYGAAFSALALGLFYMLLARLIHASQPIRCRLLTETFLALGVIFATLAIPLGLDAEWTSAAWAVEAAGLYWIGHRQHRSLTRVFALLLQFGAVMSYLSRIEPGDDTLLHGSALGAAMLGLSLLCNAFVHTHHIPRDERAEHWDGGMTLIFHTLGLWFLFLIAPLLNPAEGSAVALALGGMVIISLGLLWRREGWQANALIALLIAALTTLGTLRLGGETLLAGKPMVALLIAASLLGSVGVMRWFLRREDHPEEVLSVTMPMLSTGGLWFLYLIAPLCLNTEKTAAAWALAGLATAVIGLRINAKGWLGNALVVQVLGAILALGSVHVGLATVLNGNSVVALLVAVSFLGTALAIHQLHADKASMQQLPLLTPTLSTAGLWFLYLIAPLCLDAEKAAAALALAGLATSFIGLRLQARGWLGNAFLVQLAAGALFISNMQHGSDAGGVFALGGSGWHGLIVASLIGLASLTSIGVAVRDARERHDETLVKALAWMMVFGLGFLSLAVLFVLPWQTATAVWAVCGFFLLWATQRVGLRPAFWFAVALEVVAGVSFAFSSGPRVVSMQSELTAFAHAGFWTPIVIALSAFALAWRLHAVANHADQAGKQDIALDNRFLVLPALLWATLWWVFAWNVELMRLTPELGGQTIGHRFLAVTGATVLVLLAIARRWRWTQLTGVCIALLPLTIINALSDYQFGIHPLGHWGLAGFVLALAAQFGILHVAGQQLSAPANTRLNIIANWIILLLASLELRYIFLDMGEPGSSWRWLGWVLPLVVWLLWSARRATPRLWPAATMLVAYKFSTTLPLVLVLMVWMCLANFGSGGNSAPLPYLPILNPLDLALMLVLFATWRWLDRVADTEAGILGWQALHTPLRLLTLGISFITYTCVVLRAVHHYADLPYDLEPMMHSMVVQASLSIAWSLCAIGAMILGNRLQRREVWITGAVLVAIVVAKLFLIELSNRGGLERIISFIGVGVLLLIVGYFAPLPARKENQS
ncbi:DUF2339 domain-containing protein [Uliginosibacterium gangwonense]|uniref:DUF2339 domain-containing protein n=1 Tax=Uliginosibacterium gangwonense TaxID=392736 RepID=UPI00037CE049|nr:DUF2339 domain-containing protein [Uliginosibacterium gangwonense]